MKIRIMTLCFAALVAAACAGAGALSPTATLIPTAALPPTALPTDVPPPTETAAPEGPVQFPQLIPIAMDNAARLAEINRLDAPDTSAVAISPQGHTVAQAQLNRIILFDAPFGFSALLLEGHQANVNAVSWSADGAALASVSNDGTLRIWDTSTGQETANTSVNPAGVTAVAWSPDGTKIVTGDMGGTAVVWDAAALSELLRVQAGAAGTIVGAVAWSPDSTQFATGTFLDFDNPGTIQVWDAITGEALQRVDDYLAPGTAGMDWSALVPYVAYIDQDNGTPRVWDFGIGPGISAFPGEVPATSLVWSPDVTMLAIGRSDGLLEVAVAIDPATLASLSGHTDAIHTLDWSPDGMFIVTASWDGTIRMWGVTAP